VIHLAPPSSIEAYYQEVGRAGRDGARAWGLLLSASQDLPLRRRLLEAAVDGRPPAPEIVEHKWNLFLELMRWTEGGSCRHDAILRYFGVAEEEMSGCGQCDVCCGLGVGEAGGAGAEPGEITTIVRKGLSGVARVHGRFGLTLAAKLLRGAPDERIARTGLDRVSTFGALRERDDDWIVRLLRRCVTAGWVAFGSGDRPVVRLTDEGRAVMRGEKPARLLLPEARAVPGRTARRGGHGGGARAGAGAGAGAGAAVAAERLDGPALALFEALRAWRLDLARTQGVPPYVVATDRSLRDVARLRPRNHAELMLAHGIGPAKVERYGDGMLEIIATAPPG
jgi:ATP-dependent DNA helicase RecQ